MQQKFQDNWYTVNVSPDDHVDMKVLESAANLGNLEHICEVPLRSPLLRGITNIGMQTTSVLTQLA